jgi:hypothetical protein
MKRTEGCTDTGGCPAWLFAVVMLAAVLILALTEGRLGGMPSPLCLTRCASGAGR